MYITGQRTKMWFRWIYIIGKFDVAHLNTFANFIDMFTRIFLSYNIVEHIYQVFQFELGPIRNFQLLLRWKLSLVICCTHQMINRPLDLTLKISKYSGSKLDLMECFCFCCFSIGTISFDFLPNTSSRFFIWFLPSRNVASDRGLRDAFVVFVELPPMFDGCSRLDLLLLAWPLLLLRMIKQIKLNEWWGKSEIVATYTYPNANGIFRGNISNTVHWIEHFRRNRTHLCISIHDGFANWTILDCTSRFINFHCVCWPYSSIYFALIRGKNSILL